jgi:hypothetical protein
MRVIVEDGRGLCSRISAGREQAPQHQPAMTAG